MNILALDLGTETGFALALDDTSRRAPFGGQSIYVAPSIACGTWILCSDENLKRARRLRMDRRCDPRILSFAEKLDAIHKATPLDWIIFEDVQFSSYTAQTQLWSSLRAVVWLMSRADVQIECCPVSTLKKFGAGHGAATKAMMAAAWYNGHPLDRTKQLDDNAIDALHLLSWAQKTLFKK